MHINEKGKLSNIKHDLSYYLFKVIDCENNQDPNIPHEFIFDLEEDALEVFNHLAMYGYEAIYEPQTPLNGITIHYVGVPFETLKQ